MFAERHERQLDGHRALCHDDMFSLNQRGVFAFADFHGLGVLKHSPSANQFCTCILEQGFNTFVEAVNDAFFPADKVSHVQLSWTGDGDAHVSVFLGVLG